MSAKPKIKVIKKGQAAVSKTSNVKQKSKHESAREMVSTVKNWVNEFQEKNCNNARQAFEQLFVAQPNMNEI